MPSRRKIATLFFALMLAMLCVRAALSQQGPGVGDQKSIIAVKFHPTALTDDPIVRVACLASIEGGETWMRQMIGGLDVAEVTSVSRAAVVSSAQVAMRIQLAGFDASKFRIEGPAQILVSMKNVTLSEDEVVKAAQNVVMQRLKTTAKDMEFRVTQPVRMPSIAVTPNDMVRLDAVEVPRNSSAAGKVQVDVRVLINGQLRGSAAVHLDVLQFREIAVATRRIDASEKIGPDAVKAERRAVRDGDSFVILSERLIGQRLLRGVSAGQAIAASNLTLPVDDDELIIHNRDTVRLVAVVGSVRIMVTGEAQQDGKIGQLIRVRNTDSGKMVTGRVVDRVTVEVQY